MNEETDDITTEEAAVPATDKKTSKKAIAPKAKKPKAKKESKAKEPKQRKAKAKKEPSERKRTTFTMSGERVSMKIDDVFTKHLQKIANERDLPSVGHAADLVLGVGLTRMAALTRYNAKKV